MAMLYRQIRSLMARVYEHEIGLSVTAEGCKQEAEV
jgi:hypothetical protein